MTMANGIGMNQNQKNLLHHLTVQKKLLNIFKNNRFGITEN